MRNGTSDDEPGLTTQRKDCFDKRCDKGKNTLRLSHHSRDLIYLYLADSLKPANRYRIEGLHDICRCRYQTCQNATWNS